MKESKKNSTPLEAAIQEYETSACSKFSPTKDFYRRVGINRIRFWQLVKGKKDPLLSEIQSLADFFNVTIIQFFQNEKPDTLRQ